MSETSTWMGRPLQRIAEDLSDAQDAEAVSDIIESDIEGNSGVEWKPLGNEQNNYGVIHNQANSPEPALVEIIANSFDALLMREYDGNGTYRNSHEAADALLENETVRLRTDGYKGKGRGKSSWNFTVEDTGMGQPQDKFEDLFCGLLNPGQVKQSIPFVQGKFGMGSSGVLRFCENGYKFIASASHESPQEWSWTVIREHRDKNSYMYLTIDGDVPQFEGLLNPGDGLETKEYGTVVKMYNYDLTNSSRITEGKFRRNLEKWVVNPVTPITLIDERRKGNDAYSAECDGFTGRIDMDIYKPLVKHNFTITKDFDHPELGKKDVQAIVFESRQDREEMVQRGDVAKRHIGMNEFYTKNEGMRVLLHVNGQTHGFFSESPLKTKSELPRTAEDMIVLVNCSGLSEATFSDIFMPSRDRFANTDTKDALENGIFEALANNTTLQQEEAYRRRQMNSSGEMKKFDESTVKDLVDSNPDLSDFFETGEYADGKQNEAGSGDDTTDPPESEFEGTLPPSRLDIIETFRSYKNNDYDIWNEVGLYTLEVPVNSPRRILFELNAPDGYLSMERSEIKLSNEEVFQSSSLRHGVLSLIIKAPEDASVGQTDTIKMQVNDSEINRGQLTKTFKVEYVEPVSNQSNPTDEEGGVDLPNMVVMSRDEWENNRENDEEEVIEIVGYDYENMDIYVHGDSNPYRNFLDKNNISTQYEDAVKQEFVQAAYMFALSSLVDMKQNSDSGYDDEQINNIVEESLRGQGQVLLPIILSNNQIEDWSK